MAKWNRKGTYYVYNADNNEFLGCGSCFSISNYFKVSDDIIKAHVAKGTAFPVLKYDISLLITYKDGVVEDVPFTVELKKRDSKFLSSKSNAIKHSNMVEVFKIFRRPRNSEEMDYMRKHFSIINLNRVTIELDGKSFEDGFPYRINFRGRDKTRSVIFTEHFYDKKLAEERFEYLKKFQSKKHVGSFWYDGNNYDIQKVICIYRTRSHKNMIVSTEEDTTKKTRYEEYVDLVQFVQEEFIR